MIRILFGLYRRSPFWLRELIGRCLAPLRWCLRPFRRVAMDGYVLHLDFRDNACFKYFSDRRNYERFERDAFLSIVARLPDAVVLDLGAHYGAYTLAAAKLGDIGLVRRVVAFEPDPRPRACLEESVAANGWNDRVTVLPVIIGDVEETQTLFLNARSSADNRTHQVTSAPIRCRGEHEIPATTVDRTLQELDLPIDGAYAIKMDIQGNEARALRGMRRLLEESGRFALFLEIGPYLLRSAGSSGPQLIDALRDLSLDGIARFEGESLRPIEDLDALETILETMESSPTNAQGECDDFLIWRGFELPENLAERVTEIPVSAK